jgi:hypothetical protein
MVQAVVDSINGEVSGIVVGSILFELGFRFASGRVEYNIYRLIKTAKRGERLAWAGMLRANPLPENFGVKMVIPHGKNDALRIEGWEDSMVETSHMRECVGEAAKFLTNVS